MVYAFSFWPTTPPTVRMRMRRSARSTPMVTMVSTSSSSSSTRNTEGNIIEDSDSTRRRDTLRFRCRVAYDGTSFMGFQLQANTSKRTIQGVLEDVLSRRFDQPIRVVGAGRTDAGVHSRGQAVHFDVPITKVVQPGLPLTDNNNSSSFNSNTILETTTMLPDEDWINRLQHSLNKMLPTDIRIWNVQVAPKPSPEFVNGKTSVYKWNVMRKPTGKLYSYRFCKASAMDPLLRYQRWQLDWGHDVDIALLESVLQEYIGTHDFKCFSGMLEQTAKKRAFSSSNSTTIKPLDTIRTVYNVTLTREDGDDYSDDQELYRIDIHLQGALYKMVRNMVGTAVDVSRGWLPYETFQTLLLDPKNNNESSLSRKDNPCKPAPPQGLTLERVYYDDDDDF